MNMILNGAPIVFIAEKVGDHRHHDDLTAVFAESCGTDILLHIVGY